MTEVIPEQAKRPVAPDPVPRPGPASRPARPFGTDRAADAYEMVGVIGRGGMGDVSLALDRRLGRRVAIKRLRPDRRGDPAIRNRFLREARAAAALSSSHIVHIYAIGEDEEGPYIAMEYVESSLPPATPGGARPPHGLFHRHGPGARDLLLLVGLRRLRPVRPAFGKAAPARHHPRAAVKRSPWAHAKARPGAGRAFCVLRVHSAGRTASPPGRAA